MDMQGYWNACLRQRAEDMRPFFHPAAEIAWPNTNERFTVEEFIRLNCAYPGRWDGAIEKVIQADGLTITVTHVHSMEKPLSFHVVSFMEIKDDRILRLTEYWGDDGPPPEWRRQMGVGSPLRMGEEGV